MQQMPSMNLHYTILHDNDRPLVFVGRSYHNSILYTFFKEHRQCVHVTLEELESKSQEWFDQHQFMCVMSNIAFKRRIVARLSDQSVHFFSVISNASVLTAGAKIGANVFINHHNVIYDDALIHDNTMITNFVMISHGVEIGPDCWVGPYVYFCFVRIGRGNYVGSHSRFYGYPDKPIVTHDFCNFLADSRLTQSTDHAGTWAGRRLFDARTSLELAL